RAGDRAGVALGEARGGRAVLEAAREEHHASPPYEDALPRLLHARRWAEPRGGARAVARREGTRPCAAMWRAGSSNILPDPFPSQSARGDHPSYVAARDHITKEESRARLERAWRLVGHLCAEDPAHFVTAFRRDFHARAWELYVLSVLMEAGLSLERAPRKGPGGLVRLSPQRRCWIESLPPPP